MVYCVSEEKMRQEVAKLAKAFGNPLPNPFSGKPSWVRKQVSAIIKAEIKAQGSNDGIFTQQHILELIKKVEESA